MIIFWSSFLIRRLIIMIQELFMAGLLALKDYVATHVLTCLVPAFLLAGAMVTLINRQAILEHLGEGASKPRSFALSGVSSFFLAACSCTIIPVASGLYFSGASIGVAFIILWVAPSSNILSLVYTGSILGGEIVIARIVSALLVAFIVGYLMSFLFGKEKQEGVTPIENKEKERIIAPAELILLILILLSLLLPNYLVQSGSYVFKVMVWAVITLLAAIFAIKVLSREKLKQWMSETFWFVKAIFPLLLLGVFVVGIIGEVLPEDWIRQWLGGNGLLSSLLATFIGALTYFATMTEAPFVDTLMKLGMGKGPALALLLTGPGLSLPNWLAIAKIFGWKKALAYVPIIITLGTGVGWFYGNFIP
jgi:uncharacterized membrane protein YraQ (UPF0718 family)